MPVSTRRSRTVPRSIRSRIGGSGGFPVPGDSGPMGRSEPGLGGTVSTLRYPVPVMSEGPWSVANLLILRLYSYLGLPRTGAERSGTFPRSVAKLIADDLASGRDGEFRQRCIGCLGLIMVEFERMAGAQGSALPHAVSRWTGGHGRPPDRDIRKPSSRPVSRLLRPATRCEAHPSPCRPAQTGPHRSSGGSPGSA